MIRSLKYKMRMLVSFLWRMEESVIAKSYIPVAPYPYWNFSEGKNTPETWNFILNLNLLAPTTVGARINP